MQGTISLSLCKAAGIAFSYNVNFNVICLSFIFPTDLAYLCFASHPHLPPLNCSICLIFLLLPNSLTFWSSCRRKFVCLSFILCLIANHSTEYRLLKSWVIWIQIESTQHRGRILALERMQVILCSGIFYQLKLPRLKLRRCFVWSETYSSEMYWRLKGHHTLQWLRHNCIFLHD